MVFAGYHKMKLQMKMQSYSNETNQARKNQTRKQIKQEKKIGGFYER